MGSNQALKDQLQAYKKKYYTNRLIKGSLIFSAFLFSLFILVNAFEFSLRLNGGTRALIFYGFLFSITAGFLWFIGKNLLLLKNANKNLSNEEAAYQIGNFFPEISDKLLNIIQLEKLSNNQSELLLASIEQKSKDVNRISFVNAVDYSGNKKYLRYALGPIAIIVVVLIFVPSFITESSTRIINYNTEFIPEAPFSFELKNDDLRGFKGENFTLKIHTEGNAVPQNVYLWSNGRKVKANKTSQSDFEYTFNRLQNNTQFKIEAESVTSPEYEIEVVTRPILSLFNLELEYPAYLKRENESVQNSGNTSIPEGTKVKWQFNTENADAVQFNFQDLGLKADALKLASQKFEFEKSFKNSTRYSIQLKNEFSTNRDSLNFSIETIKDRYPEITLDQYQDTVLFKSLVLGGNITDDYGFSNLSIHYKYNNESDFSQTNLEFNKELSNQSYYKVFALDSSKIKAGAEFQYFIQVSDNDGVNGVKSVKTSTYSFKIPSAEEIEEDIERTAQKVQQDIDNTLKDAQELNQKLEEVDERLKTKKEMDWQDEKLMQDIIQQKEKLAEKLKELKKENQLNNMKKEQFSPQSDEIQEKMNQLQELMNDILDDETKKLYDELKQLLEEKSDISEFREQIEEMKNKGGDLEKEIERTLELFKKLQFDMKLEENIKDLEKEIEDQEQLLQDTQNQENSAGSLSNEQSKEKQDIENLQKKMDELNELNQERKNPDALPNDLKEQFEEIKEEQQKAQEELQKESQEQSENSTSEQSEENSQEENKESEQQQSQENQQNQKRSKATKSQQRAAEKMKEMKQSLQSMQSSMEMGQVQENLEFLKELVDNLVTLSFNQESLMDEFKEIRESDPRVIELSQEQLKLKDDSKIIQDSLISLSQRVFQISSFVMREVSEMNRQMDGALDALKEKKISQAAGKQQFTMTSINNLALLLDDVVQQMQNQMSSDMSGKSKNQKNMPQPGGLSDLQKQLSQQISDLKKSGKSGRQLSEELAKLAAEQQRLRNALENFETGIEGDNLGEKIDKLIDQMEKNEEDLINKNLTDETVERQKEILTRLLEAENAINERGEDDERKGETAYDYDISIPESLNEYLKAKEKEIELLKTIPAKLNPYYKKETNKYFKRIKQQN